MSSRKQIGFDRRLDLDWLDQVAALMAECDEPNDVRQGLISFLHGKLAGSDRTDSSCGKAVRLLSRSWVNVNPEVEGLRERALRLLPTATVRERLAIHWSLCLAGFEFFGDVSTHAGRLAALQGSFSLGQVLRRVYEDWGERSTLTFAVQRTVWSMAQWGALLDDREEGRGIYTQSTTRVAVDGELATMLVEGLLIYCDNPIPVNQAIRHPALFPFTVSLSTHEARKCPRLEVHREGLDQDIVYLSDQRLN
jgi:hypothetical protein